MWRIFSMFCKLCQKYLLKQFVLSTFYMFSLSLLKVPRVQRSMVKVLCHLKRFKWLWSWNEKIRAKQNKMGWLNSCWPKVRIKEEEEVFSLWQGGSLQERFLRVVQEDDRRKDFRWYKHCGMYESSKSCWSQCLRRKMNAFLTRVSCFIHVYRGTCL